jgi:hypothetical protein
MAAVASGYQTMPFGPLRAVIVTVTHTSVTTSTLTSADHGLRHIEFVKMNNETSEDLGLVQRNKNSGGVANGSIYTTGVTSGDVCTYLILGR